MKKILVLFAILLFSSVDPLYAQTYGSGSYGSGIYSGSTPTPTPSSSSTSSGSTSGSSGPSVCTAIAPLSAPDLFQIKRSLSIATLYFTPVTGATGYHVFYGPSTNGILYAAEFPSFINIGVQSIKIEKLANIDYSFQVRAVNGCAGGPFSKVLVAKRGISTTQKISKNTLRVTPTPSSKPSQKLIRPTDPVDPVTNNQESLNIFQKIAKFFKNVFSKIR